MLDAFERTPGALPRLKLPAVGLGLSQSQLCSRGCGTRSPLAHSAMTIGQRCLNGKPTNATTRYCLLTRYSRPPSDLGSGKTRVPSLGFRTEPDERLARTGENEHHRGMTGWVQASR